MQVDNLVLLTSITFEVCMPMSACSECSSFSSSTLVQSQVWWLPSFGLGILYKG